MGRTTGATTKPQRLGRLPVVGKRSMSRALTKPAVAGLLPGLNKILRARHAGIAGLGGRVWPNRARGHIRFHLQESYMTQESTYLQLQAPRPGVAGLGASALGQGGSSHPAWWLT